MQLFSPEDLEKAFWGFLVRIYKQGIDRRTDSPVPMDPNTGLPQSANDVLPIGMARFGEQIIYEFRIQARAFAIAFAGLTHVPATKWTREEAHWVAITEMRLKTLMKRAAEEGLLNERPRDLYDGSDMKLDQTGFAFEALVTPKGLRFATDLVRSTKYEHGPVSILHGAPQDVVNQAPEWAKSEFKDEIKGGA